MSQIGDAPIVFLKACYRGGLVVEPFPLHPLCEHMREGCKLAVDAAGRCTRIEPLLRVPLNVKRGDSGQRLVTEERT